MKHKKTIDTLKRRADFLAVSRAGSKIVLSYAQLFFLANVNMQLRFAIQVRKKVGCAVFRNKIKRRIRDVIRKLLPMTNISADILIVCNSKAGTEKIESMLDQLLECVQGINQTNS